MLARLLPWFALLAAIWTIPSTAFADAASEVSLVAENGKLIHTVDHFVVSRSNRAIIVKIKANWVENLRANEQVYEVEVKPGEKKLVVTQRPAQNNFRAAITAARYK